MFGLEKLGTLGAGTNDGPAVPLTKEEIAARRKIAQALILQGSDTSPVQHWTQGAARMAQALNGALENYQADKADREAQDTWNKQKSEAGLPALLGGSSPAAPAAPSTGGALSAPGNIPKVAAAMAGYDPKLVDGRTFQSNDETGAKVNEFFEGNAKRAGLTNPAFENRLLAFVNDNPHGLGITSLDRSNAEQAALYANRGNNPYPVAPPGGSAHNRGTAADLSFETPEARQWAQANAGRYGLAFPHANDPIHVELAGGGTQQAAAPHPFLGAKEKPVQVASNDPNFRPAAAAASPAQEAQASPQAPVQVAQAQTQQSGGIPALAKLMALTGSPAYDRASPGEKKLIEALIQKQVTQETKDPLDTALKQEQLTKARRDNAAVEMERVNDPATGAWFERKKGTSDPWTRIQGLGDKPAETTGDQRELDQINRERQAANMPPLRLDEWKLQKGKANATNITNDLTGGTSKQVFDTLKERAEAAQVASTGLASLREARKAVEAGGFFGAGADARLGFAKLGQALGFEDGRITNTETFRSAIAPQISAVMKATVGSTQISNADREFAEKAAGGSIALDPKSITRLLGIMERGSVAAIERHRSTLDKVYPDTPDGKFARERALFGVDAPAEQQPGSGWQDMGGGVRIREQSAKMPATGDVLDGYRFKGGNPADKTNWERVQ